MIVTLRKALFLLTPRERRQALVLIIVAIIMALLEVAGVASVVPFLGVLANPDIIEKNSALNSVFQGLGFTSAERFLLFLGTGSFVLLLLAAVIRTFGQFALIRFAQMRRHSIGARLLATYLGQPYEFFLNRHSGDLSKTILSEADQVVALVFQPTALMIAQAFTLAAMTGLLIALDPWIAFTAALVLAGAYAAIYKIIRNYIGRIGKAQAAANRQRFEKAGEAFGGIKEIKLLGRERYYFDKFSAPSHEVARYAAINTTLSMVPRFAVEAIAFGGILLLSLILLARHGGSSSPALAQVIPLLGLYAFAGYRMLPAVQSIYQAIAQIRFAGAAVDNLYSELTGQREQAPAGTSGTAALAFREKIELRNICYSYPNSDRVGLQDISLEIPAGTTLGIVGSTGAGKTTLVDVMLGLLRQQSGQFIVDGTEITPDNMRNWQANIGYVPQEIFLVDGTIEENIALGLPGERIDRERTRHCARLAQIDRFVEDELPRAYDTRVGERGVRLSGGQRQRIGIARALYGDPTLLVFDEATSALDNLTEQEVMKAVNNLSGTKTMIIIAHRMSTVRDCDHIVALDNGRLAALGTFESISKTRNQIGKMVNL